MKKIKPAANLMGALALLFTGAAAPLLLPFSPAEAQAYPPMPPACAAASNAAQAENARWSAPPSNAGLVPQMQHILYMTGLLIDALDRSCRDWPDYERSRQQFQTQYNDTMRTCKQVASNPADCRRKAYGS